MFAIVTKYYWGDQIRQEEMGGSCDTVWVKRNARTALVGKAEGERLLGRTRHRCKSNNNKHGFEVKTGGRGA
jgi:3'-phosphoadenosine 5'-phosphosulfate sulfotransferase